MSSRITIFLGTSDWNRNPCMPEKMAKKVTHVRSLLPPRLRRTSFFSQLPIGAQVCANVSGRTIRHASCS